jgi:ATP-dependent Clp protease ATP-binding subunit ClpA
MLNRLDRVFVFRPLASSELVRIAELEIEAVIQNYGLKVAKGGIDPALLVVIVQRQQRMGAAASARDLARVIEEAVADSLVAAKQQKAGTVALRFDGVAVSAIVAN